MGEKKYVAYVGTSTNGRSKGIYLFDVDPVNGSLSLRRIVPVNNPVWVSMSHSGKYLYSIADEGVRSFKVLPDGDLEPQSSADIFGLRGCHLSTDREDRYLFVAGWYDGKVTVMHLNEDGSVGELADEVFHKGPGSMVERNYVPHVNSVVLTPDEKFLCAVDFGIDQIHIYNFDHETGKITPADILRCEQGSAPRDIIFSSDGRFAYVLSELKNEITVYSYDGSGKIPVFEKIQSVTTNNQYHTSTSAAYTMSFSEDGSKLICSSAGDNTAGIFRVGTQTGLVEKICILPVSGDYPKAVAFFPGDRYFMSLNNESDTITVFEINYDGGYFAMKGKPVPAEAPNCVLVTAVGA